MSAKAFSRLFLSLTNELYMEAKMIQQYDYSYDNKYSHVFYFKLIILPKSKLFCIAKQEEENKKRPKPPKNYQKAPKIYHLTVSPPKKWRISPCSTHKIPLNLQTSRKKRNINRKTLKVWKV